MKPGCTLFFLLCSALTVTTTAHAQTPDTAKMCIRDRLEQNGRGRVLVVDGGGSVRRALVDAELARLAVQNEWEGLVIVIYDIFFAYMEDTKEAHDNLSLIHI